MSRYKIKWTHRASGDTGFRPLGPDSPSGARIPKTAKEARGDVAMLNEHEKGYYRYSVYEATSPNEDMPLDGSAGPGTGRGSRR